MPSLQVKNVPVDVYAEVRRRADQRHQTIRDYVLALLVEDQRLPSNDDWLDEIAAQGLLTTSAFDAAKLVRDARSERERAIAPGSE